MNRSIIRKIAKENGVSVEEVMRDMQFAIEATYANPNEVALSIPRKNDVPTPEEFINHCVRMVNSQNSKFKLPH